MQKDTHEHIKGSESTKGKKKSKSMLWKMKENKTINREVIWWIWLGTAMQNTKQQVSRQSHWQHPLNLYCEGNLLRLMWN